MRATVAFLIGVTLGATGILIYLEATHQLAPRRKPPTRAEAPLVFKDTRLLIPVRGVDANDLRRGFDEHRSGGREHHAIDIHAPRGTPVLAVAEGTIRKLFTSREGGLTIYHFDAKDERCFYYAHLDRYADHLREGMTVARGQVIAYVGTSGNAPADAPHLHFAVTILPKTKEWWKGEPIDAYPLLTE